MSVNDEHQEIKDLSLDYILSKEDGTPKQWRHLAPSYWSFYGLSSWFYSIVGIILVVLVYETRLQSTFYLYEGYFWILQGYLSWKNDVQGWGVPSMYKVFDRAHATGFSLIWLLNIIILDGIIYANYGMHELLLCVTTVYCGMFCRKQVAQAAKELNYDGFVLWHSLWHVTFPVGRVILLGIMLV